MPSVERDMHVARTPEAVWEYLSDFRTSEQWDPPTVQTVRASGDGGVGTVYENTSRVAGRDVQVVYEVTAFEPPKRIQLRGDNKTLTAVDTITLTETEPGSTRVHYHARFTLKGAARAATPLVPVLLGRLADRVQDSLTQQLTSLPA